MTYQHLLRQCGATAVGLGLDLDRQVPRLPGGHVDIEDPLAADGQHPDFMSGRHVLARSHGFEQDRHVLGVAVAGVDQLQMIGFLLSVEDLLWALQLQEEFQFFRLDHRLRRNPSRSRRVDAEGGLLPGEECAARVLGLARSRRLRRQRRRRAG